MNDRPFHVAGGTIAPPSGHFSPQFDRHLNEVPRNPPPETRPGGSRRRKLWEIPHKFHCPVVGVCFECAELRGMMAKVMHFPRETTDFVLHTTAVSACEERTRLSELLHKTLERRFQPALRRFAACKSSSELRTAWQQACRDAHQIPAALWATWTHPACDARLEQDVYADIHMIQHQVGAGARADLRARQALTAEKAAGQRELARQRSELETLRRQHAEENAGLQRRIAELRSALVASDARGAEAQAELDALRRRLPDLEERDALVAQCDGLLRRNAELNGRLAEQDGEIGRLREFARYAEETLESLAREDDGLADTLPCADLGGKCVLCVGGRSGNVHSYREVVEQSGGRFMHHDGGIEESLHRIDGVVAAADLVICQAGCISHNAYWRVKDLCKRTGKPCMFVRSSGVSSFGRVIGAAARKGHPPDGVA
ncbi:DUF2325 domain-containing protein [Azonexus sp.]|uniref:DUF2325 domain-containing protein n=1 Tax=Azonexus sp. TaxID=1872668 RepID=UPI0035ADDA25